MPQRSIAGTAHLITQPGSECGPCPSVMMWHPHALHIQTLVSLDLSYGTCFSLVAMMILPVKPSWRSVSAHTSAATPTRDAHLLYRGDKGEHESCLEKRAAARSTRGDRFTDLPPAAAPWPGSEGISCLCPSPSGCFQDPGSKQGMLKPYLSPRCCLCLGTAGKARTFFFAVTSTFPSSTVT